MAIEFVDLPSYKMVIFHSYVNVYQKVYVTVIMVQLWPFISYKYL